MEIFVYQGEWTMYLYYLPALILIAFAAVIIPVYVSAKRKCEEARTRCKSLESVVELQKEELENQGKLINDLARLHNETLEYEKQKTDFFTNITHELKTPLSVILGAVQLIERKQLPAIFNDSHSGKHFHTIRQNCYRLLRLVNNILDVTKIDSGYTQVYLANHNVVYMAEEITQSIVPYAEQKGLHIEFDTEAEEVITAIDMEKMEKVMLNLLSNAIKFTKPGGKISVGIRRSGDRVLISVRDNGPGIPDSKQKEIFERFRQVGSSYTRENEGSGIGLSLVKSFVELHNGTVRLSSNEGEGSEFTIELPVRLCESQEPVKQNRNPAHERVVEAINIEFSDIYSLSENNVS